MHYTTLVQVKVNKRLLYPLFSAVVLVAGTYVAIQYATGALRLSRDGGIMQGTGLLSATSDPKGAELLIDGRLVSATDDTLYLEPDSYLVEIAKEGYSTWQKTIEVMPEVVSQANARLFPVASSLTPLTFTGVTNVLPSPDGQKLLYYTASQSATQKNGLYIIELTSNTFSLQRGPRQILQDDARYNVRDANIIWSPDSSEILLMTKQKEVLLTLDQVRSLDQLPDVSYRKKQILSQWEEEMYLRERQYLSTFPPAIVQIATESAKNVYFSPNKKMLLYTATSSAMLADELVQPVPGASTQTQVRQLKPGYIYVYDREEDRNFELGQEPTVDDHSKFMLATDLFNREPKSYISSPSAFTRLQATSSATLAANFRRYHSPLFANTFQWFPDSHHLLFVADGSVRIIEHDGTNNTSLYAGPFDNSFLYPWPDGSRALITTTFSPTTGSNLYAIELR